MKQTQRRQTIATLPARRVAAGLALLAACGGATAQCNWSISNVPDFDQKRLNSSPVPGLPDDGGAYCVPTSNLDMLAYISNHGYPNVMAGPRSWQSNSNYTFVTTRDTLMGFYMGTDPVNGTGTHDEAAGLVAYLSTFTHSWFIVSVAAANEDFCPPPSEMRVAHAMGGLVTECWGRYTPQPYLGTTLYTRDGGHCTAVVGMSAACSSTPTVKFRDPADDTYNTTQSTFATSSCELQPVTALFRNKSTSTAYLRTQYLFTGYSGYKFLDSFCFIIPLFGLTIDGSTDTDQIQILRPVRLDDNSLPAVQSFQTPTGGAVRDLAIHPRMTSAFYITGPTASNPVKVFRLDPTGGTSTEITGFDAPTRLCTSRQGDLFVLDGRTIYQRNPDQPPGTTAPPSAASQDVDSIVFDDFTDLLVGVDYASRTLYQWQRGLGNNPPGMPLPAGPIFTGRGFIAISPADGSLWMTGRTSPAIYKIVGGASGSLTVADSIPMAPGTNQSGLHVNKEGHVFFASNGQPREMERDAAGNWIDTPAPVFTGLPVGLLFDMPHSRTNFDPDTMVGPEWTDILNPPTLPGVLDCYANCDASSATPVLNINDFICFQSKFAAGNPEANCDDSTAAPVLNVNDFICFQARFAAGCP